MQTYTRFLATFVSLPLLTLALALTGCGVAAGVGDHAANNSDTQATSAAANATSAAGGKTFVIHQGTGWSPASLGIPPHGTITWLNFDTTGAHPIECAPLVAGHDPCPWTGTLALPAASRDAGGNIVPSAVSLRFDRPGLFYFRDALHSASVGQIVCGGPGTAPGSTP